jgi:hypothetical protein
MKERKNIKIRVIPNDGRLYLHGENGEVASVEATPEAYREKGRFTPPDQPSHPGGADEKSVVVPSGGEWKALYPGPGHAVVLRCENAVNVRYLEFALQNFLLLLRRVPFVVRGHSLEAA